MLPIKWHEFRIASCALSLLLMPPLAASAAQPEAGLAPPVSPVDAYLADDFTDSACAGKYASRYEPMLGYDKSMAAQIDSYLTEDFAHPAIPKGLVASSYRPLAGYGAVK